MGYSDGSQAIRAWLKLRDVGTVRTLLIEKKLPPSPAQKKKGFRGSRGHGGGMQIHPPYPPYSLLRCSQFSNSCQTS